MARRSDPAQDGGLGAAQRRVTYDVRLTPAAGPEPKKRTSKHDQQQRDPRGDLEATAHVRARLRARVRGRRGRHLRAARRSTRAPPTCSSRRRPTRRATSRRPSRRRCARRPTPTSSRPTPSRTPSNARLPFKTDGSVSVDDIPDSQLIEIKASDDTPEHARARANAYALAVVKRVQSHSRATPAAARQSLRLAQAAPLVHRPGPPAAQALPAARGGARVLRRLGHGPAPQPPGPAPGPRPQHDRGARPADPRARAAGPVGDALARPS